MMKFAYAAFLVLFLTRNALAGGIELNKKAVSVSPPDPQGNVVIAGAPGCVIGLPPIYIMARNKEAGTAVNASAFPNGSFNLMIPASGRDSVKLSFVSANGKKREITVKVPETEQDRAGGGHRHNRSEVNVDLGQFSQYGAPEVVQVKPDNKGGTFVHVGDRPPITPPAPLPTGSLSPPPIPSPELQEIPYATSEELAVTPSLTPPPEGQESPYTTPEKEEQPDTPVPE